MIIRRGLTETLATPSLSRRIFTRPIRRFPRLQKTPQNTSTPLSRSQKWTRRVAYATAFSATTLVAYNNYDPFRHSVLAADRIGRVVWAVSLGVVDYKRTFSKAYEDDEMMLEAYAGCHKRSAERLLLALKTNGGIFIKLGQHISSVNMLPWEWTSTMRPLQDQCFPTPMEALEAMYLADTGVSIDEQFSYFDPEPIGVASLAQVHIAHDRKTGRKVAVKLQHPHLEEFAEIDMKTATACLSWVKAIFPEFEFTWLGEEMRKNLPLELDFCNEAANAEKAKGDFSHHIWTTLYIPEVFHATKRTMVMEFIDGGRVDDLEYLNKYHIDRNAVSRELTKIFSEMVYINGFFHADPHAGNLLIRPAPSSSRSRYNFEIALLDHGLYFDIDDELRINYAHLWLSLIAPPSAKTNADRRKYAQLVGNISPEMYPVFESAITGRANLKALEDAPDTTSLGFKRAGSLIDSLPQSEVEIEAIRRALMQKEGLLPMLFALLRRMPRRVLMILKLNDLTRNLDNSLATTHPRSRIFMIIARYCALAVWLDERKAIFEEWRFTGPTWNSFGRYFSRWWDFHKFNGSLRFIEFAMDAHAQTVMMRAWLRGLWRRGFVGASRAAAGLEV